MEAMLISLRTRDTSSGKSIKFHGLNLGLTFIAVGTALLSAPTFNPYFI
jgi:hypothetical protein